MRVMLFILLTCLLTATAFADFNTGFAAFEKKDYHTAFKQFTADSSPQSLFYLAVMYTEGYGVEQNEKEAGRLYKKSAEMGYDEAEYTLGVLYGIGEAGFIENKSESEKWLRKAANQGHRGALWMLALEKATENNNKQANKKNKPSPKKDLEDDILMSYEEYQIARAERMNAAAMYDPKYHNLAHPRVAPFRNREELAAQKVRLLLVRYREKYEENFDLETKYWNWKINR